MSKKEFLQELQAAAKQQASLADDYLLPRSLSRLSLFFFDHSFAFMLATSFLLALVSVLIFNYD